MSRRKGERIGLLTAAKKVLKKTFFKTLNCFEILLSGDLFAKEKRVLSVDLSVAVQV